MIEVTDEMVVAFEEAYDDVGITGGNTRAGIAAVLAIVERDYHVSCGAPGPDGERCARPPRHDEYHAFAGALGLVMW